MKIPVTSTSSPQKIILLFVGDTLERPAPNKEAIPICIIVSTINLAKSIAFFQIEKNHQRNYNNASNQF